MNHADVKKYLADYLEGDLALEERALVDAHLDHCDACSREVEEMLQTIRLLRTLPEPELPPMIAANVMRRIRAGESEPRFMQRVSRAVQSILEPTFVLPASAIAVAALVVTVTQGTVTQGTGTQGAGTQGIGTQGIGTRKTLTQRIGTQRIGTQGSPTGRNAGQGAEVMASAIPSLMAANANRGRDFQDSRGGGRGLQARLAPRTIRLRVDGSGVARLSMSRRPVSQQPDESSRLVGNPRFTSAVPDEWAAQFARVMYGDQASLARGTLVAADPSTVRASEGLVQSVALSRTFSQDRILADLASDGADPRDAWLALGFEDPAEFARYIASQNLAEQELWAARLSQRAEERGLLDEFLKTLRESGDVTAGWVAGDFEAQSSARSLREPSVSAGEPPLR